MADTHGMVPRLLRVHLHGKLTRDQLESALAVRPSTPPRPPGGEPEATVVVLDCLEMTDYELDARHAFVEWLRATRPRRVAILTDRAAWRLVIRTMSMASSVPLQWFSDPESAERWLNEA